MKVYAHPKTRTKNISFPLGFAYVDDSGLKECKDFDPHISIICDGQGNVLNCKIGQIPPGAKLPKDFFNFSTQPENTEQDKPVAQLEDSVTPSMNMKKTEIQEYMKEAGIDYNSGDTKADLIEKIKWHENA